jgi:hypothetical protein
MTSEESPISWITPGKLDAVGSLLDVKFRATDTDADSFNVLIDALATTASSCSRHISLVSESLPSHLYPRLKEMKMKDIADPCSMLGS